jgi:hypothetical protein
MGNNMWNNHTSGLTAEPADETRRNAATSELGANHPSLDVPAPGRPEPC